MVAVFPLVQRIKSRMCCLQSVRHVEICEGQPQEGISRQGELWRVRGSGTGGVTWLIGGTCKSSCAQGAPEPREHSERAQGLASQRWELACRAWSGGAGQACVSCTGQLYAALGKHKMGFVACWLYNTDSGFFYNKNSF